MPIWAPYYPIRSSPRPANTSLQIIYPHRSCCVTSVPAHVPAPVLHCGQWLPHIYMSSPLRFVATSLHCALIHDHGSAVSPARANQLGHCFLCLRRARRGRAPSCLPGSVLHRTRRRTSLSRDRQTPAHRSFASARISRRCPVERASWRIHPGHERHTLRPGFPLHHPRLPGFPLASPRPRASS